MKIVDLSIKRPVTVSMMIAILLFLGIISLKRIPIDLFPDIQKPVVRVQTKIPGSGPQEVEQMVTLPIEREIATTENLVQMTSRSVEGLSEIRLAFRWNTNLDASIMDLRQKLDLLKTILPEEAEKSEIKRFDPSADPILIIDVAGPMGPNKLRIYVEDNIAPHLDRVPGVAAVKVSGGARREFQVEIDPALLTSSGLSFTDVATVLQRENIAQPSGRLEEGRRELLVRTLAELRTGSQIEQLVLTTKGQVPIRLRDVASVTETLAERREFARLDGKDSVQLEIFKENEANTLNVIDAIRDRLKTLSIHRGISLKSSYDQSLYIREALGMVRTNAYIGAILAALVLLFFLRNVRSAFIITISMPVSIIVSFVPLYFTGISLNIFSLAGLALAVGLVVDNSIVILENIFRHMSEGENSREASLMGTKEVETAVLASTTTTMAVFLPIVFVSGMAGQVFKDLSFSVAYVLGISELIAISLIPLAAARIFKHAAPLLAARKRRTQVLISKKDSGLISDAVAIGPPDNEFQSDILTGKDASLLEAKIDRFSNFFSSAYLRLLDIAVSSLVRRTVFVILMFIFFVVTMVLLPELELFPRGSQRDYRVRIQTPVGIALDESDRILIRAEKSLMAIDQVETTSSNITDEEGVIESNIVLLFKTAQPITAAIDVIHNTLAEVVPAGHTIEVQPISLLEDILREGRDPRTFGDLVYQVEGENFHLLQEYTKKIRTCLDALPMVAESMDTIPARKPEVRITLDRRRAADIGIQASTLADTVQRALSGKVASTILDSGRHIDIRVRSLENKVASLPDIGRLPILIPGLPAIQTVPVSRVANIERSTGPVEIQHYERQRVLYATARIAAGYATGEALSQLTNVQGTGSIDLLKIPSEIQVRMGGAAQTMVESFDQLYFALIVAVVLVYMIMAAQFESLIHPFVVMFSVPLSLIGASIGLHIGNEQLSVTAFIGIIVLVGIAVNDAILLVSTTNLLRTRGYDRWEAIKLSGQQRLRPIFMTTLTTVFGMFPLAWGLGPGSEFYEPLALVVIFGLLFATFLTLVLIPAVYLFVDDTGDVVSFTLLRLRMNILQWRNRKSGTSDSGPDTTAITH